MSDGTTAGPVPQLSGRTLPEPKRPSADIGPTVTAMFSDGPLEGTSIEAEVVEGRPAKTIDVPAQDRSACRYCFAGWVQIS